MGTPIIQHTRVMSCLHTTGIIYFCLHLIYFRCETTSDSLEIRLVNGKQSAWLSSGRVEVRHVNGSWGTVCSDRFDNREALVICKMFGHQYGIARSRAYFGRGTGHIFMDDLNCKGNESSILDCPYNGWGRHNCGHHQDAGVQCTSDGDKSKYSSKIKCLVFSDVTKETSKSW